MNSWISELCGAVFMPHGQCYLWNPTLIGLHAVSDTLIAFAYYSIPLSLLYFVRKRRDLPFPSIFLLFGGFIVACGTTHLLEVWTIWHPQYWLSGGVKFGTAAISLFTAVALVRAMPVALELPGPDALRLLNNQLEDRVRTRTADLTAANAQLRREAEQRLEAEAEVRRLNATLERRVAELQTLFDLLPVGVGIATDATCRTIRTNDAFATILGLPRHANASLSAPPGEARQSHRIFKDGRELPPAELPMQRAAANNTSIRHFEETIVRNDGTHVDVLVSAVPIRDDAGQPTGCVATFQDLTTHNHAEQQRQEFERRLQETQKLESIGVLAGGIAHDFNNLLTGILGYSSLVRTNLPPSAVAPRRMLGLVETSAKQAAELCRQLLAYAGKGIYVLRSLSLNSVVTKSTALLEVSLGRHAALHLELADDLPLCRGDSDQLRQVLVNLVTNASEAIAEKAGTVTIRTTRTALTADDLEVLVPGHALRPVDHVCLDVVDDGCGMPPATLVRIFEPFFTTKFIGRGLGLPVALGIVHGLHGGIRITSAPGTGTTVRLLFPLETASQSPAGHSASAFPVDALRAKRVLVVDDEQAVRHFAADALVRAGYRVTTANDGLEALAAIRAKPNGFDAVLLDVTMPRLDGESTLLALRTIAPDLPVVLMSGHKESLVTDRFVGRGLADFLQKPFVAEDLTARLEAAIARRDGPPATP